MRKTRRYDQLNDLVTLTPTIISESFIYHRAITHTCANMIKGFSFVKTEGFYLRSGVTIIFFIIICFCSEVRSQEVAVKTNLAYWGTTTPNIGLELALNERITLDFIGGLNLFKFSNNRKFKHWLIQPELRWWFCESFNGHFVGAHLHGAQYNVGGWDIPVGRLDIFNNNRYEGYLYGGGLSYGYQWILTNRLNFELNVGAGYARTHYSEYPCQDCGTKLDEGNYNYWGITKLGLSIIYFIK